MRVGRGGGDCLSRIGITSSELNDQLKGKLVEEEY
jgi:hypothetical protein